MNSSVALVGDSHHLSQEQIDLIKRTIAKGTTDDELALFLHACKRTGLDPLMKQLYAIKRMNNKTGKEDMSIQTGIDGYRLIADRTGQYAGSDEASYMLGEDGFPDVASVTVYKLVGSLRCAFSSSARWNEYCQAASPMWKKMPFLMLAKCAEALALRKAFPAELSGVYTHEEMMQADSEPAGKPIDTKQAFAQKFPEQAKAIQEKLKNGTGVRIAVTMDELANIYDKQHPGASRPARTLKIETVTEWAGKRTDLFDVGDDDCFYLTQGDGAGTDQQAKMQANTPPQQASNAPASLLPAYLEQIALSETVTECSKTLNMALKDETLSVFDVKQLQVEGQKKILELRAAKAKP